MDPIFLIAMVLIALALCGYSFYSFFRQFPRYFDSAKRLLFAPHILVSIIFMLFFLTLTFATDPYLNDDAPFYLNMKTWHAVAKEFFFAFFIALAIIFTIEITSKREQSNTIATALEDASKNVFNAIFKNRIHEKIYEEIEESIFLSSFLRKTHDNTYEIEKIPRHPKHALLRVTSRFVIQNTHSDTRWFVQKVHNPEPPSKLRYLSVVNRVDCKYLVAGKEEEASCSDYPCNESDCARFIKPDLSNDEVIYHFPSVKLMPNQEVAFELCYTLVKDLSDNEVWTSLYPTLESSLTVISSIDELKVSAMSLHRGKMSKKTSVKNHIQWQIGNPILPHQGHIVYWRPKK